MAQIPQINNPITSKNYNYSPRQQDANTDPFDIVKLTGISASGAGSDSAAKSRLEMGNRELIPLQVQMAKDPTLAVEMLKDLLNVEVLNQALITGHTELYGSLQNLAKELYITPEELVDEIQNQEQQNTMFSGHEFYDVLREVAQTTTNQNTKELIGNLLKSINFAQNKAEILGALRANLKFLSEYYSPNEKLSQKLFDLSQKWGADDADQYFDYLKGETLAILKDVSGSLLNDDKTQMLLPLITHNLSRYNNNPYMCKEYFNLLLTQISSGTLRESLKNSFNRLYSAIFDKQPMQNPKTMEDIANLNEQLSNTNYTTNPLKNQPLSDNSSEKNSLFSDVPSQIQQNNKISAQNIGEIATQNKEPIAVFNDKGEFIGYWDANINRLMDEDGNIVPFEQPEFRQNNKISEENFGEAAAQNKEPFAVFDDKGEFVGYLDPNINRLTDENGNIIPYQSEQPEIQQYKEPVAAFDDKGELVGYWNANVNRLVDEKGAPIDYRGLDINRLTDEDGNIIPFRSEQPQFLQNTGISPENIGKFAADTQNKEPIAIFDVEGELIGYQDPNVNRLMDENGNIIPFMPEQPVFDDEGRQVGFLPAAMFDEYGSLIAGQPLMDEEGNFLPFQPEIPVFDEEGSNIGFLASPLYDENGDPIQQTLVDRNGNPIAFTPKVAVYDESGEQVGYSANLISQNGNLVLNQPLIDINGNLLLFVPALPLYDENGNVAAYQPRALFNEEGEAIMQPLVDADGYPLDEIPKEPVFNNAGEQIGYRARLFDENGNRILNETVFDEYGNPITESAEEEHEITGWHKFLNELMSETGYTQRLKAANYNVDGILNAYNRGKFSGTDALKTLVDGLFSVSDDPEAQSQAVYMRDDMAKINTMQEMIDWLNGLLKDMPDIVDKMAVKSELPQHGIRPPVSSTLDNLTDFIQTNINNPALKSLDSFNASNLLQSLLNAPGVFTPLAHYILPLEVANTRAFGELWVDNDENNPNNTPETQRNYHLFLTFDVESIGRFELDVYALGEDVNLSLLYPPRFEREIEPMKERVNKVIRNIGYRAQNFETAPLKKPHNLVEVFPKITDKRITLNKRV